MDLKIFLNNTDISHIVDGDVNIDNATNGQGASVGFMYHYGDPLDSPKIHKGDVVRVEYTDGDILFHGTVDTLDDVTNTRDNRIPVVALDDTYQLKLVSVDKKVYVNKTVSQIMSDVLVDTNISADPANQTVIPRIVFNRSNLRDVVYKLAKSQQADWVIDNGVLKFIRAPSEQLQPPTRDNTQDFTVSTISSGGGREAMFVYKEQYYLIARNSNILNIYLSNRSSSVRRDLSGSSWVATGADIDHRDGTMFVLHRGIPNSVHVWSIGGSSHTSFTFIKEQVLHGITTSNSQTLLFVPGRTLSDDDILYIGSTSPNELLGFKVDRDTKELTHDPTLTQSMDFDPHGSVFTGDIVFIAEEGGSGRVQAFDRDNLTRLPNYDFTIESGIQAGSLCADSRNIYTLERNGSKMLAYTLPVRPHTTTDITLDGNQDIIRGSYKAKSIIVPPYSSVSVIGETGEGDQDVSTKIVVPSTFNANSFFIQTGIRFRNLTSVVRTRSSKTLTVGLYGLDNADTSKEILWSQSGGFLARGAGYTSGDLQANDELTLSGNTEYRFSGTANVPTDEYVSSFIGDYDGGDTSFANLEYDQIQGNANRLYSICKPLFVGSDIEVSGIQFESTNISTGSGQKFAILKVSDDLTIDSSGNYSFSRIDSVDDNIGRTMSKTGTTYTVTFTTPRTLTSGTYIICMLMVVGQSLATKTYEQSTEKVETSLPLLSMYVTSTNSSNYFSNGTDLSTITPSDFSTQQSTGNDKVRSFNYRPMKILSRSKPKSNLVYYTYVPVSSDELADLAAERIAERLTNNKVVVSFAVHNGSQDKLYLAQKYRPGSVLVVKAENRSGAVVDVKCIVSSVSYNNRNGLEKMIVNAESERFDNTDDVFADLIQNYNEAV